ncbi:MAG: FeS cluster assembly scaffold IscU [Gammaproteobacteria bacterium]|nr:FeS cluster assembly scaffold IscU [Gammaproteobacteria bacterium]
MMKHPIYNEIVLSYFFNTKQADSLQGGSVLSAMVGSPAQGGVLKLQLQISGDQIKNAVFKAYGNAALIAAAEYLCETVIGLSIAAVQNINAADIAAVLSLPRSLFSTALLVEDTLKTVLGKRGE